MSKHMSLLISTLLLSHCAWAQQSSTSHEFTIVADGREQASIVTSRNPSVSARFAAVELQEHVKQITGVELSIVTEDVATVGPRILVGSSDATAKLGIFDRAKAISTRMNDSRGACWVRRRC